MDVTSHCSPFQRGSPDPVTPQPPAGDITADTKQSTTPALGLSPMVPPSQGPQGQLGLPTKPPARKIPEREAGEPELTAEVAGLRVGKYQRPLVEAIRGAPGWPAVPSGVRDTEGDQEPLGLCATRGWLCAPHAGYVCTSAAHTVSFDLG